MSRSRLAVLALILTGCTHTFGLEQVALDDDHDGFLDDADNCPDTFNPVQEDFDRDGVGDHCSVCMAPSGADTDDDGIDDACDACVGPGVLGRDVGDDGIDDGCEPCPEATGQDLDVDGIDDACDSCLRGPPLDEDGDGVANACDGCPSRPDPMQEHAGDSDRLGDACDPDTDPLGASGAQTLQTPRMFDGFDGLTTSWLVDLAPTVSDGVGHLAAKVDVQATTTFGLFFLIETSMRFTAPAADSTFTMFAPGSGQCALRSCYAEVTCTLSGDGLLTLTSFNGTTTSSTTALDLNGPITLWFRSSTSIRSPGGGITQMCVGVDVHGTIVTAEEDEIAIPLGDLRFNAYLSSSTSPVDLGYVWIVNR